LDHFKKEQKFSAKLPGYPHGAEFSEFSFHQSSWNYEELSGEKLWNEKDSSDLFGNSNRANTPSGNYLIVSEQMNTIWD
jgi:hypothetical protein